MILIISLMWSMFGHIGALKLVAQNEVSADIIAHLLSSMSTTTTSTKISLPANTVSLLGKHHYFNSNACNGDYISSYVSLGSCCRLENTELFYTFEQSDNSPKIQQSYFSDSNCLIKTAHDAPVIFQNTNCEKGLGENSHRWSALSYPLTSEHSVGLHLK